MDSGTFASTPSDEVTPALVTAGVACTELLADPASWINRRVETVELLSHEETRRRVSVDFTLTPEHQKELELDDGVVVPLSILTKEARRNFDLRDEGGRAVPVLAKQQNGELAHIALVYAAADALLRAGQEAPHDEEFEVLVAELRHLVFADPEPARAMLSFIKGSADRGDVLRSVVWRNGTCRRLLKALSENYVLFAVLPPGGPVRRILKYSYGDESAPTPRTTSIREKICGKELIGLLRSPDRRPFEIPAPAAHWGASFHMEVAIPQELRVTSAVLYDVDRRERISREDRNVNRVSLYAPERIDEHRNVAAYLEIAPERRGTTFQAFATSSIVAALLWLGVLSQLDVANPSATVSLLLAGAALFSGFTAARGAHRIVNVVFSSARRWLGVVTLCALTASATLAMEIPDEQPIEVWQGTAIACTLAAVRLEWSAIRAPA